MRIGHILMAVCMLAQVHSQGSDLGRECTLHSECSSELFCAEDVCTAWEGFTFLCGRCRPCEQCRCHTNAIDGLCPARCPFPKNELRYLEGIFVNTDVSGSGTTCLRIWTFEGTSFRRHDTGLMHKEALRSAYYLRASDGTRTITLPSGSPCKASTTYGYFSFVASPSVGIAKFGLQLRVPVKYEPGKLINAEGYDTEVFDCERSCPGRMKMTSQDGSIEVIESSAQLKVFPPTNQMGVPRYANLLNSQTYKGKIYMFDTICEIFMEFWPAGIPGLVYFKGVTQHCDVGKTLAPDMQTADWHRQHENELRYASKSVHAFASASKEQEAWNRDSRSERIDAEKSGPTEGSSRGEENLVNEFGKRRLLSSTSAPMIRLPYLISAAYDTADLNLYDFSQGYAVGMEMCQPSNTRNITKKSCYPSAYEHARCVQYPLKKDVNRSIHEAAERAYGPPSSKYLQLFQYDCRCNLGLEDQGCKVAGHTENPKCGSNETWATNAARLQDESCDCGEHCVDVDECVQHTHNCHEHASCSNTFGSFSCSCNFGFQSIGDRSGIVCKDDDECALQSHDCHKHADCQNIPGSFTCSCKEGFTDGVDGSCIHTSEVRIERAWAISIDLGWTLSWNIKVTPDVQDIIAIYKGVLVSGVWTFSPESSRLASFFYVSATPCSGGTEDDCGEGCLSPCRVPGSLDKLTTTRHSSSSFRTHSLGAGTYRAVLFSNVYEEILAVSTFTLSETNAGISYIPADSKRIMTGGVLGCEGLQSGSRCCVGLNRTLPGSSCLVPLEEVMNEESNGNNQNDEAMKVSRCGDGRLELASGTTSLGDGVQTSLVPLEYFGQSDGRSEECDDGNNVNGDGCDTACRIEINSNCSYMQNTNMIRVDPTNPNSLWQMGVNPRDVTRSAESSCIRRFCGDSLVNLDGEECDDGNSHEILDGCRNCKIDTGWKCVTRCWEDTDAFGKQIRSCSPSRCSSETLKVAGNPLLNESACPHCNTTAGECIYFAYEYRCRCIKGYAMLIDYSAEENWINNEPHIPTDESPHNCDDVDECGLLKNAFFRLRFLNNGISDDLNMCDISAKCTNTPGATSCACPAGTNGTGNWGDPCIDINECGGVEGPDKCHNLATCSNFFGGFKCTCNPGFEGEGLSGFPLGSLKGCRDIDECTLGLHDCSDLQICENIPGTFVCTCKADLLPFEGGCYPYAYYDNNKAFLNKMRWFGPKSFYGLTRLMEHPYFSDFASVGFGWWLFLDQSMQFHQMLHSLAAVAPSFGAREQWDPITCDPLENEVGILKVGSADLISTYRIVDNRSSGTMQYYERMFMENDFIFEYELNPQDKSGDRRRMHVKWHVLRLNPGDRLLICGNGCTEYGQNEVGKAFQDGIELMPPFKIRLVQRGLLEFGYDTMRCGDLPGWKGIHSGDDPSYYLMSCSHITPNNLEEHCVATNKNPETGTSALQACCICGGGSFAHVNQGNYKLENSYENRRYKLLASFFLESDKYKGQSKPFFENEVIRLRQEIAEQSSLGSRKMPHIFAISNGAGITPGFPKCLTKKHIPDSASFINLETQALENLMLQGTWRGTCNPDKLGKGRLSCNVYLIMRQNSFELRIDGCPGYSADRMSIGVVSEPDDKIRELRDQNTLIWYYKRIQFFHSSGAPSESYDAMKAANGVFAWKPSSLKVQDEMTLVLYLPGGETFPGEEIADITFQRQSCEVMQLRTIPDSEFELPPPRPQTSLYLSNRARPIELYRDCNNSIAELEKRYTQQNLNCLSVLEGLIGTRVPLDGLSSQQLLSMEKACSNDACFLGFNSSLYTTIDQCTIARISFTNIMKNFDNFPVGIDDFFASRLIFLAETRTRVELTCTSNYLRKSCRSVVDIITGKDKGGCSIQSGSNHSHSIGWVSRFAFNMQESSEVSDSSARKCKGACKEMLVDTLSKAHCCAASFYETQTFWMDIVGPQQTLVNVDLKAYKCLYEKNFDCSKAVSEPTSFSRKSLPTSYPVQYPVRTSLNERCSFSEREGVKCAFEICDPDVHYDKVTKVVLPWPRPCCIGLKCQNGGVLPYAGACFCECKSAYIGNDCSEEGTHMTGTLTLEGAQFQRFDESSFSTLMVEKMTIMPHEFELAYVRPIAASRRGKERKTATSSQGSTINESWSLFNDEYTYSGHIPRDQRRSAAGLAVGFRIKMEEVRALQRASTRLNLVLDSGQLTNLLANAGYLSSGSKVSLSKDLTIMQYIPNSQDTKFNAQLAAATDKGTKKESLSTSGGSGISRALYIALFTIVGVVGLTALFWILRSKAKKIELKFSRTKTRFNLLLGEGRKTAKTNEYSFGNARLTSSFEVEELHQEGQQESTLPETLIIFPGGDKPKPPGGASRLKGAKTPRTTRYPGNDPRTPRSSGNDQNEKAEKVAADGTRRISPEQMNVSDDCPRSPCNPQPPSLVGNQTATKGRAFSSPNISVPTSPRPLWMNSCTSGEQDKGHQGPYPLVHDIQRLGIHKQHLERKMRGLTPRSVPEPPGHVQSGHVQLACDEEALLISSRPYVSKVEVPGKASPEAKGDKPFDFHATFGKSRRPILSVRCGEGAMKNSSPRGAEVGNVQKSLWNRFDEPWIKERAQEDKCFRPASIPVLHIPSSGRQDDEPLQETKRSLLTGDLSLQENSIQISYRGEEGDHGSSRIKSSEGGLSETLFQECGVGQEVTSPSFSLRASVGFLHTPRQETARNSGGQVISPRVTSLAGPEMSPETTLSYNAMNRVKERTGSLP